MVRRSLRTERISHEVDGESLVRQVDLFEKYRLDCPHAACPAPRKREAMPKVKAQGLVGIGILPLELVL